MVRIILTGYTEPKDLIDAINRGEVYRYITKPWDLNDLLFTIRNGLESYALRREKEQLLNHLKLRLNAMTVFLDLSKEFAHTRSYEEIVHTVVKYLPYIVDFDVCASLIEQGSSREALLNLHTQKPVHEDLLFEARTSVLDAYRESCGRILRDSDLLIHLTGERSLPQDARNYFASKVHVLLKSEGEPAGLIQLFSFSQDAFREDTQEVLDILANQASDTIRSLRVQLSVERQRLELMLQSLADGVIMVDDQDRVFVINPAARRLLHLSQETPVNTRYLKDTLGFYPFDLVRGWNDADGSTVKEEIKVFDRILHSIVSPVRLDDRLIGVAVVLRDITEEKNIEERKEEFVNIISHELRTPLTSIGGALDLLIHRFAGDVNDKQDRYLRLAKSSCDKLNMIIDELLDISRFEKGKLQLDLNPIELCQLIRDAVENYNAAAHQREIDLVLDLKQESIEIEADRNRLHQVLNNLLSNALKFCTKGGLTKIEIIQNEVISDFIAVSVFNDGNEIDEKDQERIFDKFEQARRNRDGNVVGSGLGLSICKGIIEAHEGCIWVESGKGQGTRFIFTLPARHSGSASESSIRKSALNTTSGSLVRFKTPPLILLAHNESQVAFLLKGYLLKNGYRVLIADDVKETVKLARERHPHLIVMNIGENTLNGLEITDILQHDPETRETPVLLMSRDDQEEESYRVQAAAFVKEPIHIQVFAQTVENLLEARNIVKRLYKVLIVDDDPAIRSVCREVLEKQGYAILEAESGREALEKLSKNSVDVVLLDVMLPDFDGFQVTEKIREDRNTAGIPIIFISARGGTSDRVRALKLGADDYMIKPFDALVLGARVESVIKRKERELDSSPTTKLPGSIALERELGRRLLSRKGFTLCYLDLDNLKAYNDYYGYAKADGVIQQTGDLIRKAVERLGTPSDFVGHIAGDDFVLITETKRLESIANEIISSFDRVIPLYYHHEDQQKGYIEAKDRFGQMRRFGIMSISLAALHVEPGTVKNHVEIAELAAQIKNRAKSMEGSVLIQETTKEVRTDP